MRLRGVETMDATGGRAAFMPGIGPGIGLRAAGTDAEAVRTPAPWPGRPRGWSGAS